MQNEFYTAISTNLFWERKYKNKLTLLNICLSVTITIILMELLHYWLGQFFPYFVYFLLLTWKKKKNCHIELYTNMFTPTTSLHLAHSTTHYMLLVHIYLHIPQRMSNCTAILKFTSLQERNTHSLSLSTHTHTDLNIHYIWLSITCILAIASTCVQHKNLLNRSMPHAIIFCSIITTLATSKDSKAWSCKRSTCYGLPPSSLNLPITLDLTMKLCMVITEHAIEYWMPFT